MGGTAVDTTTSTAKVLPTSGATVSVSGVAMPRLEGMQATIKRITDDEYVWGGAIVRHYIMRMEVLLINPDTMDEMNFSLKTDKLLKKKGVEGRKMLYLDSVSLDGSVVWQSTDMLPLDEIFATKEITLNSTKRKISSSIFKQTKFYLFSFFALILLGNNYSSAFSFSLLMLRSALVVGYA